MENNPDNYIENTPKQRTLASNASIFGFILGAILIFITLISFVIDVDLKSPSQFVCYIAIIGIQYWGTKTFRDTYSGGFIKYGRSVASGVLISFFASIICGFFMYIYYKFIDITALQKTFDLIEQKYIEQGMSDDMMQQSLDMVKRFMSPAFVAFSTLFTYTFVGTIMSLLVSIVLKKEDKSFESNFN